MGFFHAPLGLGEDLDGLRGDGAGPFVLGGAEEVGGYELEVEVEVVEVEREKRENRR